MKKILSAFVFLTMLGIFSFCSAYTPYDDDPDYIYLATLGSGGYSHYLYLPSIDVQEYNPPHYQIAGNIVAYGGKKIKGEMWSTAVVRFNWYTKETFSKNYNDNWVKEGEHMTDWHYFRKRADALFYAAYRINFYGY